MAIEIETPEGAIVEFPDNMSGDAIKAAMQKLYPAKGSSVSGASAKSSSEEPSSWSDVAKSIPSGLARGAAAVIGLPGSVGHGMRYLTDQARQALGYQASADYVAGAGKFENALALSPEPKDITNALATVTGPLYEPQTTAGRYANAISEFAGANLIPGGGIASRAEGAVPATINTAQYIRNALVSSAGGGVAEQGAKDIGAPAPIQALAAIAGGGAAHPDTWNALLAAGRVDPRMLEKTAAAQAAQEEGITVPRAAIDDSILKPVAGRIASLPIVGAPLQNTARESLDQVENRLAEIADAYGSGGRATTGSKIRDALNNYIESGEREAADNATQRANAVADAYGAGNRATAGTSARDAIVDWINNKSEAPIKSLYGDVDSLVDQGMAHPMPADVNKGINSLLAAKTETGKDVAQGALSRFMDDINTARSSNLSEQQIDTLKGIAAEKPELADAVNELIGPKGLTYGQIKELRTIVGTTLKDKLRADAGTSEPILNGLYGNLSDYLRSAVERGGGPEGLAAFERANTANRLTQGKREALYDIVGKGGEKGGEDVFNNIIQLARQQGSGANIDKLKLVRQALPDQQWNDLSSALVRRMSTDPKTGMFSKDRLLSELSSLSPEGKDLLFNAPGKPGLGALQNLQNTDATEAALAARRQSLQGIVGKRGENSGENVFDSLIEMASNKGKNADLRGLAVARRSIPDKEWGDMSSAFIRRMGINPKTDEFSPDRFLTAYGNLSPQGRAILFSGQGQRSELAHSLDNLSQVSKQFSEFYKMGNPSGTGGANFITGLFGVGSVGGMLNPIYAIGSGSGLASMWVTAKLFARPANVDKMTRTLQTRLAYAKNPTPSNKAAMAQAASNLVEAISSSGESQQRPRNTLRSLAPQTRNVLAEGMRGRSPAVGNALAPGYRASQGLTTANDFLTFANK